MNGTQKWIVAVSSAASLLSLSSLVAGQPTANLDHDIVDENNEPFDMNDLVVDGPMVLLVSSGT